MLNLNFQASTAGELLHHIKVFASQLERDLGMDKTQATEATPEVVEEPKKEKKASAKKPKDTPSVDAEFKVGAEAPAVDESVKAEVTKEHVVEAAQKLSSSKNMDAAREVLGKFKNAAGEPCRRISDVQPADFAAFVEACEKALA
jgi:hypothetical protein